MQVKPLNVYGWEAAIRGMRNPLNSWDKSDTIFDPPHTPIIGENDLGLMQRLCNAGSEHRKYLRMIQCAFDIRATHVFWAEFDTYKIGTVRNSCSKMHRIHVKPFVWDDFSTAGIAEVGGATQMTFQELICELEWLRNQFNTTYEKKYWVALLELLPMGYELQATVMLNYETCLNIVKQRDHHKWIEWPIMRAEILRLPYFREITGVKG